MFINQKEWLLFQQDSENNSQEPEITDSEEVTSEEEKEEEKKETPKPKPKKTTPKRKPVTKKKTTVIEEETSEEDDEEEPIKSSKTVPPSNLELENRILKSAIETNFDADALTAFVMRDLKTDENGTDNFDELVKTYVEKYPSLVKSTNTKPQSTPPISPTNVKSKEQRETELRNKFYGNNNNSFFNGSGVRN